MRVEPGGESLRTFVRQIPQLSHGQGFGDILNRHRDN